jgi:hypothetical protein
MAIESSADVAETSTHRGEWSLDPGVGHMDPGETSVDVKCVQIPGGLELGGPCGVKGRPLAEV